MTATNANEQTVLAFFSAVAATDSEHASALLTEDVSWTVMAKGMAAVSRDEGRDLAVATFFVPLRSVFKERSITSTTRSIISSGDLVMVETSVRAEGVDGRVYENQYAWAIELREGRISAIREYTDSLHATRYFGIQVPAEE